MGLAEIRAIRERQHEAPLADPAAADRVAALAAEADRVQADLTALCEGKESASRARLTTLPTTQTSGLSAIWSAPKPSMRSMPSARNWSLMGGYTPASHPVTLCPASRANAATPPMNVPQMPRI